MTEEWRWIPDCEGWYEVSNEGRVRSHRSGKPRLLSTNGRAGVAPGYPSVCIRTVDGQKLAYVHRLVLAAFVGPLPPGLVTRHLNGNREDNRLKNLQYGTQEENAQDTIRHGTRARLRTVCKRGHVLAETGIVPGTPSQCLACRHINIDRNTEYMRLKRGTKKPQRRRARSIPPVGQAQNAPAQADVA